MQETPKDSHPETHQPGKEKHISEGLYFAIFLLLAGLTGPAGHCIGPRTD